MRWLPSFEWYPSSMCFDDAEYEGCVLVVRWGRLVVELSFGSNKGTS